MPPGFSSLTAEELIGKTDADLLSEQEAIILTAIKQQVLASGKGTRQNVSITITGKTILYDLTVELLHDNAGAVVGITCATLDVTCATLDVTCATLDVTCATLDVTCATLDITGQQCGQRTDSGANGTLLSENNGGSL